MSENYYYLFILRPKHFAHPDVNEHHSVLNNIGYRTDKNEKYLKHEDIELKYIPS